jgi:hypothetical protein
MIPEIPRVMPEPMRLTVNGDTALVLGKAKLPVRAPLLPGANVTENVVLCDGLNDSGVASPLILNVEPLMVAWVTVTPAVPGLLSVTVFVELPPNGTPPKSRVAGAAIS